MKILKKHILLVILCCLITACPQREDLLSSAETIVCFGDSLTYGTGASEGFDYPSQLARLISKPVINAGTPGDTTADGLQRLDRDVLSLSPDVVLMTLGGNDLKNGIPVETAFRNLKHIVESIQKQDIVVIIGGLSFGLADRGYGKAYRNLAKQTGAVLVPNMLEGIIGNQELMSDPIHPNDRGYALVAERFFKVLKE